MWLSIFGKQSDIQISTVCDYGDQELGLFAKRGLNKHAIIKGPKFLLLEVDEHQEGLNTQMQFEDGKKTLVGCGPARLVNVSVLLILLTESTVVYLTCAGLHSESKEARRLAFG